MKDLLLGLLIGGALGLWVGVNMGKEQPLFSNPFKNPPGQLERLQQEMESLRKDMSEKSKKLYDDTRRAWDSSVNE